MWQYALVAVVGFALALAVAVRPSRFWPMLIVTAIVTSGVMINGHATVDEILMGFILLGALLPVAIHARPLRGGAWTHPAVITFLGLAAFMLIEALRGTILLQDWRMLRWIAFYGMIGLLVLLASQPHLGAPDSRRAARLVTAAGAVYFLLYLGHGVLSEWLRGLSRWDLQGVEWAGSAYAMFPLVVVVPAAVLVLGADRRRARALAFVALLLSMAAAAYYESRIAWLAIAIIVGLGVLHRGLRRRIVLYGLGLAGLAVVLSIGWHVDLPSYVSSLWQSALAPVAPRESDIDRRVHLIAGIQASSRGVAAFVLGSGMYAHRDVLPPYLSSLYAEYLPGVPPPEIARTVGFSTLLVDGGIVAIALLGSASTFAAQDVYRRSGHRSRGLLLLGAVLLIPLWTLVSNIQDIMLFYIALMPSGLMSHLAPSPDAAAPRTR